LLKNIVVRGTHLQHVATHNITRQIVIDGLPSSIQKSQANAMQFFAAYLKPFPK